MKRTILFMFVLCLTGVLAAAPINENEPTEEVRATETESIAAEAMDDNTWVSKLVDQDCKDNNVENACPVTSATERFGLVIDGGIILPLTEEGNQMTKETLAGAYKGNVEVTVVGKRSAEGFAVQSIKVNK